MLHERNITGTFYIPIQGYGGRPTISTCGLRQLSNAAMEIGAHTISHRNLIELSQAQVRHELVDGKNILEHRLGAQVDMFCYPNGRYNAAVIRQVQEAGYLGARTTRMLSVSAKVPAYTMPTSLQAFPHGPAAYMRNLGRSRDITGLADYILHLARVRDWVALGISLFDHIESSGGLWHLYGHSWEIAELNLWGELGALLDHVANRKSIEYLTNRQVVSRDCRR